MTDMTYRTNGTDTIDVTDKTGLERTIAEVLARVQPVSHSAYRQHVWQSEVRPALRRWGIQERHLAPLDDFGHARQARAFEAVCDHMKGVGAIVALIGIRGCGKTTIAAQFARRLAWRNHEYAQRPGMPNVCCRYLKASDLVGRFKSLYADFGSVDGERLMESRAFFCQELEYLVIDELHEVADQKLAARLIPDLLDRRYAAKRDTLLISNQTPEDFQASMSDSVLSRLQEHGMIIPCNWESWRGRR